MHDEHFSLLLNSVSDVLKLICWFLPQSEVFPFLSSILVFAAVMLILLALMVCLTGIAVAIYSMACCNE